MASLTGNAFPTVLVDTGTVVSSDTSIRPDFYDSFVNPSPSAVLPTTTTIASGSIAINLPLTVVTQSNSGVCFPGFVTLFYDKIQIEPTAALLGNIATEQEFTISVWNSFFIPQTLTDILLIDLDGVTIDNTFPLVFAPLEQIVFTVTVPISGDPQIDGLLQFDFLTVNDFDFPVTGSRTVAFPYMFGNNTTETILFKTDVLNSYNGTEQRVRVRNSPRHTFNINMALPPGEVSLSDSLMWGWGGRVFALPMWQEARGLTAPTSIASATISVDTEFANFVVGELIIIYTDPRDFDLLEIVSFTTTEIVVGATPSKVYPAGTLLAPIKNARITQPPQRSSSGAFVKLAINFSVLNNDTLPTSPDPIQYKGLDVYLEEPLTQSGFVVDSYVNRTDVLDYGSGAVDFSTPWTYIRPTRTFNLLFDDAEDTWNHRLWLHRRAGKLVPFWMPTFEDNLKVIKGSAFIINKITIQNDSQIDLNVGRLNIALHSDDTWFFREIVSIEELGENLEVTVDTDINVDPDDVDFISYMGIKRLTSDQAQFNWSANNTAQTSVQITELEP